MVGLAALFLQVQMGVVVRPETVTVGQHFSATVRVRIPNGVQLRIPAGPDTSARVDTVRAPERRSTAGPQFTETTVSYMLAAWDTGRQKLGLGAIGVSSPAGERTVSLGDLSVYVKSVLPPDTAQRKPKPPRPTVSQNVFNWLPWAVAAVVAMLLGLLAFLWRRRRRAILIEPGPLAWAEREFARVESTGWLDGGESERYAIAMADVARRYLSLIDQALAPSLTTRELAEAMRGSVALPRERLVAFFENVDPLKFAARPIERDDAARIGTEARSLVADIDRCLAEARVAQAEARDQQRAAA